MKCHLHQPLQTILCIYHSITISLSCALLFLNLCICLLLTTSRSYPIAVSSLELFSLLCSCQVLSTVMSHFWIVKILVLLLKKTFVAWSSPVFPNMPYSILHYNMYIFSTMVGFCLKVSEQYINALPQSLVSDIFTWFVLQTIQVTPCHFACYLCWYFVSLQFQ